MAMIRMVAGAGVAMFIGVVTIAAAQTGTDTASEAAKPGAANGPIVPRRSDRARASAPAARAAAPTEVAGKVDWAAVNAEVADTSEDDAAADRQIRAMELTRTVTPEERAEMQPKGLRSMAPRQWKNVSASEVRQTTVPVLVPTYGEGVSAMRVAARENSYTAFCDLAGGAYVEILGTRMRVVGAPGAERSTASLRSAATRRTASLDAPYTVSRHEQGVDLSFSKFNVAYQISVFCPDPVNDPRCATEAYAIELAESLALLNQEEGAGQ